MYFEFEMNVYNEVSFSLRFRKPKISFWFSRYAFLSAFPDLLKYLVINQAFVLLTFIINLIPSVL